MKMKSYNMEKHWFIFSSESQLKLKVSNGTKYFRLNCREICANGALLILNDAFHLSNHKDIAS